MGAPRGKSLKELLGKLEDGQVWAGWGAVRCGQAGQNAGVGKPYGPSLTHTSPYTPPLPSGGRLPPPVTLTVTLFPFPPNTRLTSPLLPHCQAASPPPLTPVAPAAHLLPDAPRPIPPL
eukprot:61528-Chlamydomonas_euryale.AAC.1